MATTAIRYRKLLTANPRIVRSLLALAVAVVAGVLLAAALTGGHAGQAAPARPSAASSAAPYVPAVIPEPYPTPGS